MTREQWLLAAVELMRPHFKAAGYKVPKVRVSCGWTYSSTKTASGECWPAAAATDKTSQIFIGPRKADAGGSDGLLETLVHEVCHASLPPGSGHGPVFKKCALAVGLEGKMRSTTASAPLVKIFDGWIKKLGKYPHAALKPGMRPSKVQNTRMIKCTCEDCGYIARTVKKWIEEVGAPLCPCNEKPMAVEQKG